MQGTVNHSTSITVTNLDFSEHNKYLYKNKFYYRMPLKKEIQSYDRHSPIKLIVSCLKKNAPWFKAQIRWRERKNILKTFNKLKKKLLKIKQISVKNALNVLK